MNNSWKTCVTNKRTIGCLPFLFHPSFVDCLGAEHWPQLLVLPTSRWSSWRVLRRVTDKVENQEFLTLLRRLEDLASSFFS